MDRATPRSDKLTTVSPWKPSLSPNEATELVTQAIVYGTPPPRYNISLREMVSPCRVGRVIGDITPG